MEDKQERCRQIEQKLRGWEPERKKFLKLDREKKTVNEQQFREIEFNQGKVAERV